MTDCERCDDTTGATPLPVDNPPGRGALAARIGTFGSFRRTMLDAIAGRPALAGLTTRESDDHSIALLEQWAAVADVLTFYTERYLNEAFLGTATGDDAVHGLVRLVGYRPRPGVSATTTLALTLLPGISMTVAAGFGVQSVPGPGERPQDFETLDDLAADARLNVLPARPPRVARTSGHEALIEGPQAPFLAARLVPGTPVLILHAAGTVLSVAVSDVEKDGERLRVTFSSALPSGRDTRSAWLPARSLRLYGWDAPQISPPTAVSDPAKPGGIRWELGSATDYSLRAGAPLTLDRVYEDLTAGTPLLVQAGGGAAVVARVTATSVVTAALAGRSAAVTQVELDTLLDAVPDRRAVRIVQLEPSPLPLSPDEDAAGFGTEVWVPGTATITEDGRLGVQVAAPIGIPPSEEPPVLVPADLPDERRVVLADGEGHAVSTAVRGATRIEPREAQTGQPVSLVIPLGLDEDDLGAFDPHSTRLLGNAVRASHGKTVLGEILGSGDASVPFQRFVLSKGPLTRVPTPTPEGSSPALTVRVDGFARRIVPQLLDAGPVDEVVTLQPETGGRTAVVAGNGEFGARMRTGSANVVAHYRYGAGLAGRVGAGTLTTVTTRMAGVDAATNPAPAEGGAEAESPSALRTRAPASVRVLGRAVTATDCAELLVTARQVGKAQAAELWDGRRSFIALSVAAEAGGTFSPSGLATLAATVKASGPPYRRVVVGNAVAVPIRAAVRLFADPRADADAVVADVRTALLARLSFDEVDLGGHLALSELYRVGDAVPGVQSLVVTQFGFHRPPSLDQTAWERFGVAHGSTDEPAPERLRLLRVRLTPKGVAAGNREVVHAEYPTLADDQLTVSLGAAPVLTTAGGLA